MRLYANFVQLVQVFTSLGAWQKRVLALWRCGVIAGEVCQLSVVVGALVSIYKATWIKPNSATI